MCIIHQQCTCTVRVQSRVGYLVGGDISEPFRQGAVGTHEELFAHAVDEAFVVRDNDYTAMPRIDGSREGIQSLAATIIHVSMKLQV